MYANGDRSLTGKALGCEPSRYRFESGRPPQFTHERNDHENQTQRRRTILLLQQPVNDATASHRKRTSSAARVSSMATKSYSKNSVATTRAHAVLKNRFKKCCMQSGHFRRRAAQSLSTVAIHRVFGRMARQRTFTPPDAGSIPAGPTKHHAPLAQRIERRASNAEVGGLNPSWRASFPSHPICLKNANRIRRRTHCQRVRLVSSSLVRLVIDLAYAAVRERRI